MTYCAKEVQVMLPKNAKWVEETFLGVLYYQLMVGDAMLATVECEDCEDGYFKWSCHVWKRSIRSWHHGKTLEAAKAAAEAYVSKWFEEVMR